MIAIDMEMPSSCGFCALLTWIGDGKKWFCPVTGRRFMRAYDQRQDDCPLRGMTELDKDKYVVWLEKGLMEK
jgi:hypothetical protein